MEAYFDNAATTKVLPQVKDLMVKIMEEDFGNPSSLHMKGVDAEKYVRQGRETLARLWKVDKSEIIFTSGGTESNNWALMGAASAKQQSGQTSDHNQNRTSCNPADNGISGNIGL